MTDVVDRLSKRLGVDIPDADELTTQEKAFLLMASNAVTKGQPQPTIESNATADASGSRFLFGAGELPDGLNFTNRSAGPIWQTSFVRGAPAVPPQAQSSDFRVSKDIFTLQGNRANLGSVSRGDRLVVKLSLIPEQKRTNPMIVEDLLPAGFEIEAVLRPDDGQSAKGAFSWIGDIDYANVTETRDDRFVSAIDVRDAPATLAYVVRAVTPGDFTLPGVVAEDMYRPEVFARSASGRVTIEDDAG